MNITKMSNDDFALGFLKALLRSGEMEENAIASAFEKAKEYQISACMLELLLDGKVNAKWDGKQFYWQVIP